MNRNVTNYDTLGKTYRGCLFFIFQKRFCQISNRQFGKVAEILESRWEKLQENPPHNLIICGNIPRYFAWMLRTPLKYNQICIVFLGKMWNNCRFTQNICVMTIISFYSNRAMRSASCSCRCLTKLIQNFFAAESAERLRKPRHFAHIQLKKSHFGSRLSRPARSGLQPAVERLDYMWNVIGYMRFLYRIWYTERKILYNHGI